MHFVGGGPLEGDVIALATKLGISDRIVLHGKLSAGQKIFEFIDSLDLYLQFSKTEGLPRALIEAISRGCPSISSDVGGVHELLPADLLVRSMDVDGLAKLTPQKIQALAQSWEMN